jgi:hypothetical protein
MIEVYEVTGFTYLAIKCTGCEGFNVVPMLCDVMLVVNTDKP